MRPLAACLQLAGLVVSFAGALLLAISQRKSKTITEGRPSSEVSAIVLEYPGLWQWGLYLLCFGFVIQVLEEAVR